MRPRSAALRLACFALASTLVSPGCVTSGPGSPGDPGAPGAPAEHMAAFDGGKVCYVDAGLGDEGFVLVHGWACDASAWRYQLPELADLGRVVAVDLPGHGKSEPVDGEASVQLYADAVAAVMDAAGLRRAVLVGHSNGTPVVLSFAARHPERTLGLVTLDGAYRPMMPTETAEEFAAPLLGEGYREWIAAMIDGMRSPSLAPEDHAAIRAMALSTPHAALVEGFRAALAPSAYPPEAARLELPVLAVYAASPFWDASYEDYVRTIAPNVDYRVWNDVGHFIQMERPEDLRAALEEFLAANELF